MFAWNHSVVSNKHVNPLDTYRIEQIHRVFGSRKAIPSNPDLL